MSGPEAHALGPKHLGSNGPRTEWCVDSWSGQSRTHHKNSLLFSIRKQENSFVQFQLHYIFSVSYFKIRNIFFSSGKATHSNNPN